MNREEIKELLSAHLRDLKTAAEKCDEKNLGSITSAMLQTAVFLAQMELDEY